MQTKTIAIIEDDEDDLAFICLALEATDSNVMLKPFSNGKEFLKYIGSTTDLPDIVITDLRMPVVTGWDLISNIKSNQETKHIPVAVLSTSSNRNDIDKATSLGACVYRTKPHSQREYKDVVASIIENCSG